MPGSGMTSTCLKPTWTLMLLCIGKYWLHATCVLTNISYCPIYHVFYGHERKNIVRPGTHMSLNYAPSPQDDVSSQTMEGMEYPLTTANTNIAPITPDIIEKAGPFFKIPRATPPPRGTHNTGFRRNDGNISKLHLPHDPAPMC